MKAHHPRELPPPWETVLLLNWDEEHPESEPICETGYYNPDDKQFCWHNAMHNTDWLEPHAWMPLPLLPERAPE